MTAALDLERLADLVAARLEERQAARSGWVSAEVVAAHLGVEVGYVYEHAAELGACRLGDGPRARLRFRLDLVDAALCNAGRASGVPARRTVERKSRSPRRRSSGTGVPLLPIRGSSSA